MNGKLGTGYDISLDIAKIVVFQYKRPKKARVRGSRSSQCQWLFFKVNMEQVYTLVSRYAPGEAFIACPVVPDKLLLSETLERSVYIDVYAILLQTLLRQQETRYIAVEYRPERNPSPHVVGKYAVNKYSMRDGIDAYPYYRLKDRKQSGWPAVYSWAELASKIESCEYGLPIQGTTPHDDPQRSYSLTLDAYLEAVEDRPESYETLSELFNEIRARFDRAYQSYLARLFTLRSFARIGEHDQ